MTAEGHGWGLRIAHPLWVATLLLLATTFPCAHASPDEPVKIWVDETGSDSEGCGTEAQPCKTVAVALELCDKGPDRALVTMKTGSIHRISLQRYLYLRSDGSCAGLQATGAGGPAAIEPDEITSSSSNNDGALLSGFLVVDSRNFTASNLVFRGFKVPQPMNDAVSFRTEEKLWRQLNRERRIGGGVRVDDVPCLFRVTGQLFLKDVNFMGNSGVMAIHAKGEGAVVAMTRGGVTKSDGVEFHISVSSMVHERPSKLTMHDVDIVGNAPRHASINVDGFSTATVQEARILNNTGTSGPLFVQGPAQLVVRHSLLAWNGNAYYDKRGKKNYRTLNGGAIRASPLAALQVENCDFRNNMAWNGGAIYVSSGAGTNAVVRDSTFAGNSGKKGGAIAFVSNEGDVGECFLLIERSKFIGCNASYGGALFFTKSVTQQPNPLHLHQVIDVKRSIFEENEALKYGGAVYTSRASLPSGVSIADSTFHRNKVSQRGGRGGAVCMSESALIFKNCTVTANKARLGGGLHAHQGLLQIVEASIRKNTAGSSGGGFYVSGTDVNVARSEIVENSCQNGAGASFESVSMGQMNDVSIRWNSAGKSGGGIHLYQSEISFKGVTLIDNNAVLSGGGLRLIMSRAEFTNNVNITKNSAKFGGGAALTSSMVNGGGVVFYKNVGMSFGGACFVEGRSSCWCDARFVGDAIIDSNTATVGGGLFFNTVTFMEMWLDHNCCATPEKIVHIYNNTADLYGDQKATLPFDFVGEFALKGLANKLTATGTVVDLLDNDVIFDANFKGFSTALLLESDHSILQLHDNALPPMNPNMTTLPMDVSIFSNYSKSVVLVKVMTWYHDADNNPRTVTTTARERKVNQLFGKYCPEGSELYFDHDVYEECRVCPQGTYSKGGSTKCSPCPAGTIPKCSEGEYGDLLCSDCSLCHEGTFSPGSLDECSACPVGSMSSNNRESCECGPGFYGSGMDEKKVLHCTECPRFGRCAGGKHVTGTQPGYWSHAEFPGAIYACPLRSQQCGGDGLGDSSCLRNTYGPLCATCLPGYYQGFEPGCSKCSSSGGLVARILTLVAIVIVPVVVLFCAGLARGVVFTTIRIFFFQFQIWWAFEKYPVMWPFYIQVPLNILSSSLGMPTRIGVHDCLTSGTSSFERRYLLSLLLFMGLSFSPVMVGALQYLVLKCCRARQSRREDHRHERIYLIHTSIRNVLWFSMILYPFTAVYALRMFSCRSFEFGEMLTFSLLDPCHTRSWAGFIAAAAFVVVYDIGFPVFLVAVIASGSSSKQYNSTFFNYFIEATAFLCSDLKADRTYYEVVQLLYRLTVDSIPLVMVNYPSASILALTLANGLNGFYVCSTMPFTYDHLNHIAVLGAIVSLGVSVIGISGLQNQQDHVTEGVCAFIFASLAFFVLVLMGYWVVRVAPKVYGWVANHLFGLKDDEITKFEQYHTIDDGNSMHVGQSALNAAYRPVGMNNTGYIQVPGYHMDIISSPQKVPKWKSPAINESSSHGDGSSGCDDGAGAWQPQ